MTVGIIGAGAAGMAAALAAAENPGVQVVLLERQARVGRKLQAMTAVVSPKIFTRLKNAAQNKQRSPLCWLL